ncbi:uncharacterized protein FIBRA_02068 [Fibroporia radiculosa]|uniref:Heterokaryon incompatibility domain-containing protein n=1 Tax=Fibroporia radiculosa TaxID=599839 RepID=J4HUB5_9APHY|nr:uncharacterized protein FIBRA_02068 [Fibroporia radiculosa]CCM00042.1 predicted protein [Fibroporia radiculosa]
MSSEEVLDIFTRFIHDEMPIRLINLYSLQLVDRFAVKDHFQVHVLDMITQDAIQQKMSDPFFARKLTNTPREDAIRELVQGIVRYAIFSHRWLDSGEPTYEDMLRRDRPTGPGYDKLLQFCSVARQYVGVDFGWSDTCCIDKSSSAELDESIRSMFKWYKTAHICVVLLSQTASVANLHRDQWFRRGWTLQELLAPVTLKFFGKGWADLTSWPYDIHRDFRLRDIPPSSIVSAIAKGSGIDERTLLAELAQGPHSIPLRMSWAARRRTTRGEDRAYSLMGIFDVSFPIAYGEGSQRAFARLIEAIMQSSPTTDILHWAGYPGSSYTSRALPSSPDSYDYPVVSDHRIQLSTRQQMVLTNLGLQITLLILPVESVSQHKTQQEQSGGLENSELRLHCEAFEIGEVTVKIKGGWEFGSRPAFALGVYNYFEAPESGLHLHELSAAYLLSGVPYGQSWIKISTDDIITFHVPYCTEWKIRPAIGFSLTTLFL